MTQNIFGTQHLIFIIVLLQKLCLNQQFFFRAQNFMGPKSNSILIFLCNFQPRLFPYVYFVLCAFFFLIYRLPKHLKVWFCTFFNSPVFAQSKNDNMEIGIENIFEKKPIENTILEMMSIEFSTNLMRTCVFQFLDF